MEYLYDNTLAFKTPIDNYDNTYLEYLIKMYGNDSLNYLSFEKDRSIFLSENVDGFIAYVIVNKVALCIGDPICDSNDKKEFILEFINYCKRMKVKVCFSSITKETSTILKNLKFVVSKYGEEAVLKLDSYEIIGKKTLKLRQKIKRANNLGLKVIEYNPKSSRDLTLENKIDQVSNQWFKAKNGQLTFSMGEMHLDNPLDRRYFISLDKSDEIQAILMFSPYNQGKSYFLDVMRRRLDSAPGAMEHAIITSAMKMKDEGIENVSLGIAPLVGIDTKNYKSTSLEKCMNYIYNNVKCDYEFKKLFNYKKKFSPTHWVERYIAYDKSISLLKIGYVIIKAKNGNRVFKSMIESILKNR
ncbi:hypothetical protein UT300005_29980 [Clostridium sp. CTA-5]